MNIDTGNSCKHIGYDEFNPPSWNSECAPSKSDWINDKLDVCGGDNDIYPEEFWACSDIEIIGGETLILRDHGNVADSCCCFLF